LEFKKGAFKMALDLEIPILPVTINNTHKILPTETINLFPGKADMTIHPAVHINGYNDKNIKELMDTVRDVISSRLIMSKPGVPN
ncbi:1-acyl-sn-glycerol-3-phosphate acyltransferase, partial [bacterium]|nr:1-acyl-sn-glycerol-3-phosphate acyltransferase [bacterium]